MNKQEATRTEETVGYGFQARALRISRNITLDQLAAQTGLSKGHLSRFERGQKSLSVAALIRLAAALDTSVSSLLGETLDEEALHVVRRQDRKMHTAPAENGGYLYAMLSRPSENRAVSAFLVEVAAEAERPSEANHSGEEIFLVLSGEVEIRVADRTVILGEGDYLQFPGRLTHVIKGREALSRVFVVVIGG
ncbi:helix-turn-helix domain-containing protein [Mesorhizobium sp. L-8-3]|uniref:helix-turn-helix domain-containing protein n=1 Tax=Mesorhizobium sp. L-8-3 TaxID=2744522 RepID=UPI0019255D1C|nr:XRE family transcriptional regulator [Mesorhizobium sp. L-8-3]BCH24159.1 hypothetical protein MesoLjLb_39440 [Mesorhizobium sp. L-8-3]